MLYVRRRVGGSRCETMCKKTNSCVYIADDVWQNSISASPTESTAVHIHSFTVVAYLLQLNLIILQCLTCCAIFQNIYSALQHYLGCYRDMLAHSCSQLGVMSLAQTVDVLIHVFIQKEG